MIVQSPRGNEGILTCPPRVQMPQSGAERGWFHEQLLMGKPLNAGSEEVTGLVTRSSSVIPGIPQSLSSVFHPQIRAAALWFQKEVLLTSREGSERRRLGFFRSSEDERMQLNPETRRVEHSTD